MQWERQITKKLPMFGSSINSEKVSLTLKGLGILVVAGAAYMGFEVQEAQVDDVVNNLVAGFGAVMTVWGAVRKVYYWVKNR